MNDDEKVPLQIDPATGMVVGIGPRPSIMKTIWKFKMGDPLANDWTRSRIIRMPLSANIIRVGMQGRDLCFWAVVVPNDGEEDRTFVMMATGASVPMHASYIGSTTDGPYEWHLWEDLRK